MKQKIIITAGGTGGHVFPALATIDRLDDCDITFITDKRGSRYLSSSDKYKIKLITISSPFVGGKLTRILSLLKLFYSTFALVIYFIFNRPKKIAGFGGYVCAPVFLAGMILFIPFIIHEQNKILGRTNRLFMRFAQKLALSFNETKYSSHKSSIHTGLPLRKEITQAKKTKGKEKLNNDKKEEKIILIIGGSQGAYFFAKYLPDIMIQINNENFKKLKIYHQIADEYQAEAKKLYEENNIDFVIANFFDNLDDLYEECDLIISRSGASSVFEIGYYNKAAILIPLNYAMDDHQRENAKYLLQFKNKAIIDEPIKSENYEKDIKKFTKTLYDTAILFLDNKLKNNSKKNKEIILDADEKIASLIR